jgi:hypothetical protein
MRTAATAMMPARAVTRVDVNDIVESAIVDVVDVVYEGLLEARLKIRVEVGGDVIERLQTQLDKLGGLKLLSALSLA